MMRYNAYNPFLSVGTNYMGPPLMVESPQVNYSGGKTSQQRNNAKIVISNVPSAVSYEELEGILSQYGGLQNFEKISKKEGPTQVIRATFDTPEQAQQAMSNLNNTEYQGNKLKVEPQMEKKNRAIVPRNARSAANFGAVSRPTDFPLRILVPSEMVGAIIGRQGSTIRQITQQTRARVDVHRKDNVGSVEKAITIYGNPENCTNACKRILEVMQQEAQNTNKPDIILKILAHNNLIGRIIGKSGNTIKRIMQETDTKIAVSSVMPPSVKYEFPFRNIPELSAFTMERIITVKGTIDNMSKAESQISAKLRQSYENDLQAMTTPQSVMFPGLPPMTVMATPGMGYPPRGGPAAAAYQAQLYGANTVGYPPIYQPSPPPAAYVPQLSDIQETVYLYIPNQAVGAIIGTRGSQIRNMIRVSSASIKIATVEGDKADSNERKVTVVGTPEAQWKAQYLIFEKMREEGFGNGVDEVRLTVEILVPSGQVGRIIGRGGANVRELQRTTGAIIKLPEHHNVPNSTPGGQADEEMTTVHIIGTFLPVQSAQRRIRAMISPGPVNRPPRAAGAITQGGSGNSGVGGGGGGGRNAGYENQQ